MFPCTYPVARQMASRVTHNDQAASVLSMALGETAKSADCSFPECAKHLLTY